MLHISPGFTVYIVFVTLVGGLCAGSFANCAAWRAVHGESISRGRSHCPLCGHVLGPGELIPLVSWLAQKGRCRACGGTIPLRYPLSEGLCALAYVSGLLAWGVTADFFRFCVLAPPLLAVALADWEGQIIPDRFLLLGAGNAIVFATWPSPNPLAGLLNCLWGGFAIALPLLLLVLLADKLTGRETMGGGDIKLLFMLGLYFPWREGLLLLLTACILGLLLAAVLGKRGRETIPFGPALCLAGWLTFLWGEPLVGWYLGLFSGL